MNKSDPKKKLALSSTTVVRLTQTLTPAQLAAAVGARPSVSTLDTITCPPSGGRACTGC